MAWKDIYESLRVVRDSANNVDRKVEVEEDIPVIGTDLNDSEVMNLISRMKEQSKTRKQKYEDFKYMSNDGIIGGALELCADEATQVDDTTDLPFWVESENEEFEKYMNTWLKDTIKLQDKAWLYAYKMVLDGEVTLRTYNSINADETLAQFITVGDYFELMDKPYLVSELQVADNTIGFAMHEMDKSDNDKILDEDDFIHIYRDKGEREPLAIKLVDNEGKQRELKVKVPVGTSYLDSSRQAFAILDLLDTMVLAQRVNKNALTRIYSVEVGNANKKETRNIISELKSAFKRSSLEKDKLYKDSSKTSTIANVYLPTRNGKGAVQVEEIGGNIDIKELSDLQYYTDKLFASIRVPKDFLNFGDGALFADGTMTKKDIRFARMILSLKRLLAQLVKEMVEFKMSKTPYATKDVKYTIDYLPVLSAEDAEEIDNLNISISVASMLKDLLAGNPHIREEDLIKYILQYMLKIPKIDLFYSEDIVKDDEQVALSPMEQAQLDNLKIDIENKRNAETPKEGE